MTDPIPQTVKEYSRIFESLTEDTLPELLALVSDTVVFTDPFNKVFDKAGFEAIFRHMFKTCDNPAFKISDIAVGEYGYYLRWVMTGQIKSWPHTHLNFEGVSEIRLGENGLISHHLDHWDSASQLLATLPIIGRVVGLLLKQFKV